MTTNIAAALAIACIGTGFWMFAFPINPISVGVMIFSFLFAYYFWALAGDLEKKKLKEKKNNGKEPL